MTYANINRQALTVPTFKEPTSTKGTELAGSLFQFRFRSGKVKDYTQPNRFSNLAYAWASAQNHTNSSKGPFTIGLYKNFNTGEAYTLRVNDIALPKGVKAPTEQLLKKLEDHYNYALFKGEIDSAAELVGVTSKTAEGNIETFHR